VERTLGNWLYGLITFAMPETSRVFESHTSIRDKVQTEFEKIKNANQEILGLKREGFSEGYDYRVKVIRSTVANAFATAGGGMVIFTEIIEEIRDAIATDRNNKIVDVHFADGSVAKVDLSAVTVEDVIDALLCHEMIHVASRHTLTQLALVLVLTLVLNVVRALITGAFGEDSTPHQFLLQIQDLIMQYLLNYHSRLHEYEADVTSIELMRNAGCNPLGAIYLQEILTRMYRNGCLDWIHRNLEFLFTHPYGERRKRALFAAISVIAPEQLREHASLTVKPTDLDIQRASPGICFANTVKANLRLPDNPRLA
jgi:predicted Zn-dependent protease